MTWIDLLGEVAGLAGARSAGASYLRGQVITQAVRAGASANSILRALSEHGLGIRRQQGLDLIGGEQLRQRSAQTVNQVAAGLSPEGAAGMAPPQWTGRYVHQVSATYRTRAEDGSYMLHTRTLGMTSSTLLTPDQAGLVAQGIMETQNLGEPDEGNYPKAGDILSMSLTGIWYQTAPQHFRWDNFTV